MDYKRALRDFVLATSVAMTACATADPPAPQRMDGSVLSVLDRAERSNWRIRIHADTVYEGRVLFLSTTNADIGGRRVVLHDVTRIERNYDAQPGGGLRGAAIGGMIGLIISAGGISFANSMLGDSGGCSTKCAFEIAVPVTGMFAVLGGMVGAGTDPSTKDWAVIWQR